MSLHNASDASMVKEGLFAGKLSKEGEQRISCDDREKRQGEAGRPYCAHRRADKEWAKQPPDTKQHGKHGVGRNQFNITKTLPQQSNANCKDTPH